MVDQAKPWRERVYGIHMHNSRGISQLDEDYKLHFQYTVTVPPEIGSAFDGDQGFRWDVIDDNPTLVPVDTPRRKRKKEWDEWQIAILFDPALSLKEISKLTGRSVNACGTKRHLLKQKRRYDARTH